MIGIKYEKNLRKASKRDWLIKDGTVVKFQHGSEMCNFSTIIIKLGQGDNRLS